MNEKFKETFDQIHAEEKLKTATKEYVFRNIQQRPKRTIKPYKYLLPAAACFIFMLLGLGGYRLYFTPVSVISIDINPSVEWNINRFDKVISVKNYNEDGERLSAALDVTYKNYAEALDILVNSTVLKEYLDQDEYLTLTIAGEDASADEQILQTARSCTSGMQNAYCVSADYSELEAAHEAGLSCGKYNAYLTLRSLDPTITPADMQQMSMREIRELIDALSEDNSVETESTGSTGGEHRQESKNQNTHSQKGNHGKGRHQYRD